MEVKRQQAPDDLETVRAFVNTLDLEAGQEELVSSAALARWLSEHGLAETPPRPARGDLEAALELREALRRILLSHHDREPDPDGAWQVVDALARRSRLLLRFDTQGGSRLDPEAGGATGALGRIVVIIHHAVEQGTWERLKVCRLDTCRWAFYDNTKNRSGAWCTMGVCGNRVKARAYRERRRRGG